MSDNKIYDDIYKAFIRYLDTYFIERNLKETLKLFSPNFSGFGTGVNERVFCLNGLKKMYLQDISQVSNSIYYTIKKIDIKFSIKDVGIVSSELDIKTNILDQKIALNNLRISVFFSKNERKWLIEHMHISFPTLEHGEEEAYPLKELEDLNKVLQRRVDKKTIFLREANKRLEKALKEIKTLRGILPICSYCKKIRADDESWNLLESYIMEHSDAEFSHGICPECAKKYYPDLDIKRK